MALVVVSAFALFVSFEKQRKPLPQVSFSRFFRKFLRL
jgi:hypothetical protein